MLPTWIHSITPYYSIYSSRNSRRQRNYANLPCVLRKMHQWNLLRHAIYPTSSLYCKDSALQYVDMLEECRTLDVIGVSNVIQ